MTHFANDSSRYYWVLVGYRFQIVLYVMIKRKLMLTILIYPFITSRIDFCQDAINVYTQHSKELVAGKCLNY